MRAECVSVEHSEVNRGKGRAGLLVLDLLAQIKLGGFRFLF